MGAVKSNLVRLDDAEGAAISDVDVVSLGPARFATAARTSQGSLQVAVWDVGDDGSVQQSGTGSAGEIGTVAATALGSRSLVTAVLTEKQTLKLIAWSVRSSGKVERSGSAEAGAVSDFAITSVNDSQVVTAVRQGDGTLKLISWWISGGGIERLKDISAGRVERASICRVPLGNQRIVVTAVRTDGNSALKMIAWNVGTAGTFKRLGDAQKGPVNLVDLCSGAYGQVLTAARTQAGALEVTSWDVSTSGDIEEHDHATAGAVGAVSVTSLSGTRAVTAVQEGDADLKLINWDAVDEVTRLGDASAGTVDGVAVAALGSDRLVTAVRQGSGTLKVIVWQERTVSLLRAWWGPALKYKIPAPALAGEEQTAAEDQSIAPTQRHPVIGRQLLRATKDDPGGGTIEARSHTSQSPKPNLVFEPGVEGVDAMIAVGHEFVVVTQDHRIAFFGRDGAPLPSKKGEATDLSATDFFSGFLVDTDTAGNVNRNNINRHTDFPTNHHLPMHCDPATPAPAPKPTSCINEFYDTRVHYDPASRRFMILSAARHPLWYDKEKALDTDPLVRRYFAFAVSRTEDPRDGFHQYMTTETNYSDWPFLSVNDGMVVVTHNGKHSTKDGPKPTAYLFSLDEAGSGSRYVSSYKIMWHETGGNVVPVTPLGSAQTRTFLVQARGTDVTIFGFSTPPSLDVPPDIETSKITLGEAPSMLRDAAKYRDGKLYFTCVKKITERVPDATPPRYSVRVIRVPITVSGQKITASTDVSAGFLDTFFGRNALEDDPDDLVSYELPAMTVTAAGHMAIAYGRVGVETKQTFLPECRYSVIYADGRGLYRSRLIRAGEYRPTSIHKDESKATTTTYFDALDYATATVDPADDATVWIAHFFPDSDASRYKTVVARVKP